MKMVPHQFEKEYFIHVYETGPDGRINLYSLFNFMQDIAAEHAEKLGFGRNDLLKNNHFWVLSRIFAVFKEWPLWNDTIIVRTWPSGTDKMFAMRNYEVSFPDGRPVASALSSWLIVDRATKKIQRPGELLPQFVSPFQSDHSPVRSAGKLTESCEKGAISPEFRVKISDLDINLHTNNVNYLRWINDVYDLDFGLKNLPCSAEINYLAESTFDDKIVIRTMKEDGRNGIFNHSVVRQADYRELCRIRLEWKESSIKKN